ncbi:MAG: hypothetical protein RLZZ303_3336 [Candidatus Hydrogenedentota bacterium]|jgi:CubicO group peptidase (beta-lactamase class C family)
MMRRILLLALLLLSGRAQAQLSPELNAGFKAAFTCSAVFHAGRTLDEILADELGGLEPVLALPDPVIDREDKSVSVTYDPNLPPRVAVFIDGLGTVVLLPGASAADAPKLPLEQLPRPMGDASTIPWPDGDLLPSQAPPAPLDEPRLAAVKSVVKDAFDSEAHPNCKTIGVSVVYDGRLIAEQYAPGWDMHKQYRTWSTAKSMANAIIGILVRQGKLQVEQAAPIDAWQGEGDPRKAITIEHLLEMSSGLRSPGAFTNDAYWGGIDSVADAARGESRKEPGSFWSYANYDTLLLLASARKVIGDDAEYLAFPRRELLDKIGMRNTFPEVDVAGNYVMSSQVYTTPRDLARFGLLYLNDGVWNGERILPEGWVDYTMTPAKSFKASGERVRGYGKQWWLLNNDDRVPPDTYSTSGNRGQYCTVVPSRKLVVTRMGIDPMWKNDWDQAEFVGRIIKAAEL